MSLSNPLEDLVSQFQKLPGIGEKSAYRLAFFILSLSKEDVFSFSNEMMKAKTTIQYCEICFNIALSTRCHICDNAARDRSTLCVVSDPKDIFSIEKSREFNGVYHVLGGLLSPLDGIHPDMLRIKELMKRLSDTPVKEIIFAINTTVQGDTTFLYLKSMLENTDITLSKLAHGLPMGADIEFADELTLQKAFEGRVHV